MSNEIVNSMFGAFNQKVEDVKIKEEETSTGSNLFKPDPTKSEDNVWRGIVKLLPNLHNIETPLVKKVTYWLTDPTTQKGFRFDSPKSLGKYEHCPVADAYWTWKQSGDARLVSQSENLSYNKKCYATVQILKDYQNSENDGKILIWDLPVKVQKMIDAKMYPSQADIDMGEEAHNPFDPFTGIPLVLKIGLKQAGSDTFRDWEGVSWAKSGKAVILEGETAPLVVDQSKLQEQQKAAIETILAGPNVNDYKYSEPDAATLTKVNNVLALMAGQPVNESAGPVQEKAAETPAETTQSTGTTIEAKIDEAPVEAAQSAAKSALDELLDD